MDKLCKQHPTAGARTEPLWGLSSHSAQENFALAEKFLPACLQREVSLITEAMGLLTSVGRVIFQEVVFFSGPLFAAVDIADLAGAPMQWKSHQVLPAY